MKLKKQFGALILVCMSFGAVTAAPVSTSPVNTDLPSKTPAVIRGEELVKRLEEIKAMDVKTMSKAERRELRKEVHGIKKEMKTLNGGGVYISVGAIIIILLLILIL